MLVPAQTDTQASIEKDNNDGSLASRVKRRTTRTASSSFDAMPESGRRGTAKRVSLRGASSARNSMSRPGSSHSAGNVSVNGNKKRRRSFETISQASEGATSPSNLAKGAAARVKGGKHLAAEGGGEGSSATSWNSQKTHNATAGITAIIDRKEQMENGTPCMEPTVETKQEVLRILESLVSTLKTFDSDLRFRSGLHF